MSADANDTTDFDATLQLFAKTVPAEKLRLFGCECCRRLSQFFDDTLVAELIEFGLKRVGDDFDNDQMLALRARSVKSYERLYPGYGRPSAKALIVSAAGEVAFTDSAVDAAINAAEFAVQAIATLAADSGADGCYDSTYEIACAAERKVQLSLLRDCVSDE